jgi:hypothetical protein
MTKLRFLSAALIAATMLATPAIARASHVTSRHTDANASTPPDARQIDGGDGFRGNRFDSGFGGTNGDGGEGRDMWGHWGTYYGPMVPMP